MDVSLKRMDGYWKTEINLQIENSSLRPFLERNFRGVFKDSGDDQIQNDSRD